MRRRGSRQEDARNELPGEWQTCTSGRQISLLPDAQDLRAKRDVLSGREMVGPPRVTAAGLPGGGRVGGRAAPPAPHEDPCGRK